MDRTFLVSRKNTTVIIREVAPESCAFTFSQRDAWEHAKRIAMPAPKAQDPKAKLPAQIEFLGFDGMTTVVQTVQATQDAYEARKAGQQPVQAQRQVQQAQRIEAPHKPRFAYSDWTAQDERNERVATYLRTKDGEGGLNTFEGSLLSQLESKGRLSDKQRDCIANKLTEKTSEQPKVSVPAGRYAIDNEDGELRFYKVDAPTEGRWAGYTFIKVMASDEEYPIRNKDERERILSAIAKDPKAAMLRYGKEIGCCGHCGKTLTSEWRLVGIGPICNEKVGF